MNRRIKFFVNEIFVKPARRKYIVSKIDASYIGENWSMVLLDLNEYGPKKKKILDLLQ